jgi:hypothetical protein
MYVPGVGCNPIPCSEHRIVPVFVTHTGYVVLQCKACGQGEIEAPKVDDQGRDALV